MASNKKKRSKKIIRNETKKKAGSKAPRKRGPKKQKGITAKDAAKYSGLNSKYFSKIKQEYYDIDYIDKLSPEDKAWMSSFMEEDLGARFNHSGKKVYKKKKDRLGSYDRNNARNRDIYSIAKASGRTLDVSTDDAVKYWEETYLDNSYEDKLIEDIDKKLKP